MRDSRLAQALALLDDSRCLLSDLADESGHRNAAGAYDFNQILAALMSIDVAVVHVQYATDPEDAA